VLEIYFCFDKISRSDIISSRLPLYVLHKLEIGALALDLLDRAGREFVDQIAKNNAILQDILVITARQFLAQHCLDPAKNFRFLFLVASLKKRQNVMAGECIDYPYTRNCSRNNFCCLIAESISRDDQTRKSLIINRLRLDIITKFSG